MNLVPPPTKIELLDLKAAYLNNFTQPEIIANQEFLARWGDYLIGLRRGYQQQFFTEAYNDHSSRT